MIEKFSEFLSNLNLQDDFTLIAIADGSGTKWSKPCGSKVYCRFNGEVKELQCSFSNGTNNFAEIIPFVYTLSYFGLEKLSSGKILFVSDSELTVKQGNREYTRANQPLWGAIEKFENSNKIVWKWVPRNILYLSKLCDLGAKEANEVYKTFYKCKDKAKEILTKKKNANLTPIS